MRVAVGSTNKSKILAVRKAWRIIGKAEIIPIKVESGVPEQPRSLKQTIIGAINRAVNARTKTNADYGVGIEAGYMNIARELLVDVQVAAIVDEEYVTIGFSPAFQIPLEVTRYSTLGEYMALITGRAKINEEIGAIGYFTRGMVTRTDLTYYSVLMALVPRINRSQYKNLPRISEVIEEISKETL